MRLVGNDVDNVVNTKDIIDIKKTQGPFVSSKESSECERSSQRGSEDERSSQRGSEDDEKYTNEGNHKQRKHGKQRKRSREYEDDQDATNRKLKQKLSKTSMNIDKSHDPISNLNKQLGFLSESDDLDTKMRHNNKNDKIEDDIGNDGEPAIATVRNLEEQKAYEFSLQRQIQLLEKKLESLKRKVTYKKTTYDRICKNLHVIRELLWNSYNKYSESSSDKTKNRNKEKIRKRNSLVESLIKANQNLNTSPNNPGVNRSTDSQGSLEHQNVTDYINSLHIKDLFSTEENSDNNGSDNSSSDNSSSESDNPHVSQSKDVAQSLSSSKSKTTSSTLKKRINAVGSDSDEHDGRGTRNSLSHEFSYYKNPGSSLSMPNLSSSSKVENLLAQNAHITLRRSNSRPPTFLSKGTITTANNTASKTRGKVQTDNSNKNSSDDQDNDNSTGIKKNERGVHNNSKSREYDADDDNDDFHRENDDYDDDDDVDDDYDAGNDFSHDSGHQNVSPRSQVYSSDKNPALSKNAKHNKKYTAERPLISATNEKDSALSKDVIKNSTGVENNSSTNDSTETNSTSNLGTNSHGVTSSNDENTISANSLKSTDNSKEVIDNSSLDEDSAKTSESPPIKPKHIVNPIKDGYIKAEANTNPPSYNIRNSAQTSSPQNMVVYLNSPHETKNAGHSNMHLKRNSTNMSMTNNSCSENNEDLGYTENSVDQNLHKQGQNAIRVTLDGSNSLSMINIKNRHGLNDVNVDDKHDTVNNDQIGSKSNRTTARNEELIYENFVNDINSSNSTEGNPVKNNNNNITTTYHHHHHHHHLLHQSPWNLGPNQQLLSQNYYSPSDNSNGNDLMIPKATNIQSFPYTEYNAPNSENQLGTNAVTTITTTTTSKVNNVSDSKRNSSSASSNGNNYNTVERPHFASSSGAPPMGSTTSNVANPTILPAPPSTFGKQHHMGVSSALNTVGNVPGQDAAFSNASLAANNAVVSEQPRQHAFQVHNQNSASLWNPNTGNNMDSIALSNAGAMNDENLMRSMNTPVINAEINANANTLRGSVSQRGSSGQGTNEHEDRSTSATSNNSGKSIAGSNAGIGTRGASTQVGTLTESDVFERWGVFFNERIKKVEDVWAEYHRVSEKGYSFEKLDLLWSNKWKLHCEPKFVKKFNRRLVMIKAIQNAVNETGDSASRFVNFMDQVLIDRKKPISHFYKKTNIPNLLKSSAA